MSIFQSVTAGDDPAQIYSDLGADEGVNPATQPIHCFGATTVAAVNAATAGSVTCTPQGMIIRPDRIEFSDTNAALLTISGMTIGGLPIMHGGVMPGDAFKATAVQGLRPAIAAGPNNPLLISLTNNHTAAITPNVAVKGPVIRAGN